MAVCTFGHVLAVIVAPPDQGTSSGALLDTAQLGKLQSRQRSLIQTAHQDGERNCQRLRDRHYIAKANLASASLDVRDMGFPDTGMSSQVNLPPALLFSQLPNSFAQHEAWINRHPAIFDLTYTINLSYRIIFGPEQSHGPEGKIMKSILLVNSDVLATEALQRVLSRLGFHAEIAVSHLSARSKALEPHFDLILLDLNLDVCAVSMQIDSLKERACWCGTGLIRELRLAGVRLPILVLATEENRLYETASLDAGADDYIPKRDRLDTLLARLCSHLRRREWDRVEATRILAGRTESFAADGGDRASSRRN